MGDTEALEDEARDWATECEVNREAKAIMAALEFEGVEVRSC